MFSFAWFPSRFRYFCFIGTFVTFYLLKRNRKNVLRYYDSYSARGKVFASTLHSWTWFAWDEVSGLWYGTFHQLGPIGWVCLPKTLSSHQCRESEELKKNIYFIAIHSIAITFVTPILKRQITITVRFFVARNLPTYEQFVKFPFYFIPEARLRRYFKNPCIVFHQAF